MEGSIEDHCGESPPIILKMNILSEASSGYGYTSLGYSLQSIVQDHQSGDYAGRSFPGERVYNSVILMLECGHYTSTNCDMQVCIPPMLESKLVVFLPITHRGEHYHQKYCLLSCESDPNGLSEAQIVEKICINFHEDVKLTCYRKGLLDVPEFYGPGAVLLASYAADDEEFMPMEPVASGDQQVPDNTYRKVDIAQHGYPGNELAPTSFNNNTKNQRVTAILNGDQISEQSEDIDVDKLSVNNGFLKTPEEPQSDQGSSDKVKLASSLPKCDATYKDGFLVYNEEELSKTTEDSSSSHSDTLSGQSVFYPVEGQASIQQSSVLHCGEQVMAKLEATPVLHSELCCSNSARDMSQLVDDESHHRQEVDALEKACDMFVENCPVALESSHSLVEKYASLVIAIREGKPISNEDSSNLKQVIREHCETCNNASCTVPHQYAGCLPPTSSGFTYNEGRSVAAQPPDHSSYNVVVSRHKPVVGIQRRTETEQDDDLYLAYALDNRPCFNRGQNTGHDLAVQPTQYNFPKTLAGIPQYTPLMVKPEIRKLFTLENGNFGILSSMFNQEVLGRGGNGTCYRTIVGGQDFALKYTGYRQRELLLSVNFAHVNITDLLGVFAGPTKTSCIQLMPLLQDSLYNVIRDGGCLQWLCDTHDWETMLSPNVRRVLRMSLNGLEYLHEQNIKHGDLKLSNVLVAAQCKCNVFTCTCSISTKPIIKLADFDSCKRVTTANSCAFQVYHNFPVTTKSKSLCGKELGTPGIRAPEQFMRMAPVVNDRDKNVELDGPWGDIWSFGIMTMTMFIGNDHKDIRAETWTLLNQPCRADMTKHDPVFENVCTMMKMLKLQGEAVSAVFKFVRRCLQADFRDRPTAEELLEDPFVHI